LQLLDCIDIFHIISKKLTLHPLRHDHYTMKPYPIRDLGDANPYAAQANLFPQVNKIYTNTCLFTFIHNYVVV